MLLGAAELVLLRSAAGLWLALLGWFLATAADAELTAASRRHQLGDLRIRDVMTTRPVAVPSTWTIEELLGSDVLAATRHGVFPVIDTAGRPVGVLTWTALTGVRGGDRARTPVAQVAAPLPQAARTRPDELLAEACSRILLRPDTDLIAVLDDHGALLAVVTATDVTRACQRSVLGLTTRPAPAPTDHRAGPAPSRNPSGGHDVRTAGR